MGNRTSTSNSVHKRRDDVLIFDMIGILIENKFCFPRKFPSCLDEFVDWTEEATRSLQVLQDTRVAPVCSRSEASDQLEFLPILSRSIVREDALPKSDASPILARKLESTPRVSQKSVFGFPHSGEWVDLARFYDENVLVLVSGSRGLSDTVFPVSRFSEYVNVARRLNELVQLDCARGNALDETIELPNTPEEKSLGEHECAICMGQAEQTVLPCMHALCSKCEDRWVDTHSDCPFCRQRFHNRNKRKRDQWHIESWSDSDVRRDIADLSEKLKHLLQSQTVEMDRDLIATNYICLDRSVEESLVDDDFVLLS